MAKILNQVGSLAQLIDKLRVSGIECFDTIDDIRSFRNGYKNSLQEIEKRGDKILREEITNLELKHEELLSKLNTDLKEREVLLKNELEEIRKWLGEAKGSKNFFGKIFFLLKKKKLLKREKALEYSFVEELRKPFKKRFEEVERLQLDIDDKNNNPGKWAKEYVSDDIKEQEFILSVFKENRFLFYGAEGEEQAVQELSKLPDSYTVINDYQLKFQTPIYDRGNDDRIYSVQIDHILVGPTGIYLIETKNWSKSSIESRDLFSPVKQLRRHNFAMFVLLNNTSVNFTDHWGERKISPKNIILLTGHKPQREYQYVKIVSMSEIVRCVSYGKQIFNEEEVASLSSYLEHMINVYR